MAFQGFHNWTLNPFHMMGVAGVLGAALLCAIHGATNTFNLVRRRIRWHLHGYLASPRASGHTRSRLSVSVHGRLASDPIRSYMKCSQLRRIRESYSYVNRPGHGSANLQTSKWKRASRPFLPRRQVPIGSSIKEAASSGVEVATHPFEAHVLSPTSGVYILVTAPRLVCYPQRHDFSMSLRPAWAIASIMQAASRNFIANSELVKCSVSIPRCRSRFWASTGSHYSSGTAQLAFSGIITRCISNVMRDCYPQPSRDLTDT